MTIRKGQPWGVEGHLPPGTAQAANDRELAQLAWSGLGSAPPVLAVSSGDLLETVGGGDGDRSTTQLLPMDLGLVRMDSGVEVGFVAHVLAYRRLWRGECAVIMNAAWVNDWYLGPRAHPNDGLLDVTVGSLRWRDRLMAKQRVKTGSHLPHPDLSTQRVDSWTHEFPRPVPVRVDGSMVGESRVLEVRLLSDAFVLAV